MELIMTQTNALWQNPSAENTQLTLPILQDIYPLDIPKLEKVKNSPSVTIDSTFLHAWETPPNNAHSAEELGTNIKIISDAFNRLVKVGQGSVETSEKSGPHDKVTQMDQGIEMLYRIWLQRHYPHHKIIGEEGHKDTVSSTDYVWYLDPVDGTSNFIAGNPNVTIHACCVYNGKPFVSYLGFPFQDHSQIYYEGGPTYYEKRAAFHTELIIGTEYLPTKLIQDQRFHAYTDQKGLKRHRINSIGMHIHHLIQGEVTAFYKPKIKLWDLLAPLAFLEQHFPGHYHIDMYIEGKFKAFSPFSNEPEFVDILNKQHQDNCRIGDILICPKHLQSLRLDLLELMRSL